MVHIPWQASHRSESLRPHFCPSLLRVSIDKVKYIWPTKWPTLQYFIFSPFLTIPETKHYLFLWKNFLLLVKLQISCALPPSILFPNPPVQSALFPQITQRATSSDSNHKCHNLSNAREYFKSMFWKRIKNIGLRENSQECDAKKVMCRKLKNTLIHIFIFLNQKKQKWKSLVNWQVNNTIMISLTIIFRNNIYF